MKAVIIKRMPDATAVLATVMVVAHGTLCLPAATCRGYPPIDLFWERFAPYLMYFGVWLLPFFDDDTQTRRRARNGYFWGLTFFTGWVIGNLSGPTPHNTSPLIAIVYLPFIGVPIYLCVRLVEWLATLFWSWCRGFAGEGQLNGVAGTSFRFSTWALLAFVALLGLASAGIRWCLTRPATPHETSYTLRSNLRRVFQGLAEYAAIYGTFPYSAEGPEAALYLLHDVTDASVFDGVVRKSSEKKAHYDHRSRRLKNSDYIYFNAPNLRVGDRRILLQSRPELMSGFSYYLVADRDHGERWRDPTVPVLGSWVSDEGMFLIVDDAVAADWAKTHFGLKQFSGGGEGAWHGANAIGTLRFHRDSSRLTKCVISTPAGDVIEEVATDRWGRITGIKRSPPNWQTIVSSASGAAGVAAPVPP